MGSGGVNNNMTKHSDIPKSFRVTLKKILSFFNCLLLSNETLFPSMQVAWVGVPTAPAWLPTDMLIKVLLLLTD